MRVNLYELSVAQLGRMQQLPDGTALELHGQSADLLNVRIPRECIQISAAVTSRPLQDASGFIAKYGTRIIAAQGKLELQRRIPLLVPLCALPADPVFSQPIVMMTRPFWEIGARARPILFQRKEPDGVVLDLYVELTALFCSISAACSIPFARLGFAVSAGEWQGKALGGVLRAAAGDSFLQLVDDCKRKLDPGAGCAVNEPGMWHLSQGRILEPGHFYAVPCRVERHVALGNVALQTVMGGEPTHNAPIVHLDRIDLARDECGTIFMAGPRVPYRVEPNEEIGSLWRISDPPFSYDGEIRDATARYGLPEWPIHN